jgi:RNAse (barnase) inhibitor barstar
MTNIRELITSFEEPPIVVATANSLDEQNLKVIIAEAGYLLFVIDGDNIKSNEDLFHDLSLILKFPDYFGHNWDALYDCLTDLDWWLPSKGYLLLYKNPDLLIRNSLQGFTTFINIIKEASDFWRSQEIQFRLLLEVIDVK